MHIFYYIVLSEMAARYYFLFVYLFVNNMPRQFVMKLLK